MENNEIDLIELFKLFWNKKGLIIAFLILSFICGFVYTMFLLKPKYTASTTLILAQKNSSNDTSTAVTSTDVTLNDKLISTYQELAKSNSVVREVIENLNLSVSEKSLKSEITVTAVKETQILQISVKDENPQKATRIANELGDVFSKKVAEIYKIDNINIVDEAEVPDKPSNVNHKKDILMFVMIGFVSSIVCILLINLLDNTVKTATDVENALDLVVLAEIPDSEYIAKR